MSNPEEKKIIRSVKLITMICDLSWLHIKHLSVMLVSALLCMLMGLGMIISWPFMLVIGIFSVILESISYIVKGKASFKTKDSDITWERRKS